MDDLKGNELFYEGPDFQVGGTTLEAIRTVVSEIGEAMVQVAWTFGRQATEQQEIGLMRVAAARLEKAASILREIALD